jgi:hypothetical protein
MSEKPEIDFPEGPPPTDLEITDLTEGSGAEATSGSTVSVHYVGVAHSTGEEFDASYNRGAPLDFRLGVGQVISGWDQGVAGMKVVPSLADEERRGTARSACLGTRDVGAHARPARRPRDRARSAPRRARDSGVAEEILGLELVLVGEQQVVHLPEAALARGGR